MTSIKRINIVAVGRGSRDDNEGKAALTMYRADAPWMEAANEEITFNPSDISLRNVLIAKIVDATHDLLDSGFVGAINVYTIREGLVLKYYELSKKISASRREGTIFDVSTCYRDFMTEGDKNAIAELANTIQDALDAGCQFRISDASLVNYVELVVPDGVELHEGDKLDFVNGVAENGVTVRSWKGFERKNAEVHIMNAQSEYPVYVLKRSTAQNMPKAQMKLTDAVNKLWAKCPRPELKTTEQKGTVAGLAA